MGHHVLLRGHVKVLHQALALMVLCLLRLNLDYVAGCTFELFGYYGDLFHVFGLLLVLHQLPLLRLLGIYLVLLLLHEEGLVLLGGREVLILEIQIHTLQSLMIHLIYLLVNVL